MEERVAATDTTQRGRRFAVLLGLVLTAGLGVLHVLYLRHAGALWRDEVNSVNVAALPSFDAVFAHSHLDSFPIAWVTVLHGWIATGFGDGDAGVRRLGLVVGLAAIAVIWWTGRRLGVAAPLATLVLLGMSPTTVVYGDQVRGYGLGMLAIVWSVGATWTLVTRPGWRTVLVAQAAALLAVQSYYANAFLVLAVSAGGAAVCVRRRRWRPLVAVGAVGLVAALSLAVNREAIAYAARVSMIELENPSLWWRVEVFRHAVAPGVPVLSAAWIVAALLAVAGCVLAWRVPADAPDADDRAPFAAVTAAVALAGFVWYLQVLARVPTQYWYYLSLLAVLAVACEIGVDCLVHRCRHGAPARLAAVAAVALLAAPGAVENAPLRMTTLDLIADTIAAEAGPDDLVVVLPWYCGITFARYYDGPAPWMTLPDFDDHRFHVHPQVKERMIRGATAITGELDRIARTLDAGHRVWIAGAPLPPPTAGPPPSMVPAPRGPEGWHVGPYLEGWAMQLGATLQAHAHDLREIAFAKPTRLNRWEHLPLYVAEGAP
jgi:hypothetical protein